MMAYAVARRRNEIGIRMAVGARAADVLRLVMGEAAAVCAVLALIALPATYVPARRAIAVDPLAALRCE